MPLHRRDFLRTCAAALGVSACAGTTNAKEQTTSPAQPAAPQVPAFDLRSFGEPDADLQKWGTTTFGNWRTLAESRQLQERNGFGIFLPRQSTPMEIVLRREDVRPRVQALLAGGRIPVNTTPIPVWE